MFLTSVISFQAVLHIEFLRYRFPIYGSDRTAKFFSITQLYNMCFDLWIAGQETTSSTLSWGMAYLMLNPDMQEKLHQELSRVIGSDRLVTLNDKKNLPYTNAVINVSRL